MTSQLRRATPCKRYAARCGYRVRCATTETESALLRSDRKGRFASYCLSAGGFASGAAGGDGSAGSAEGVAPRSSGAATQSPAQSLVPLTVPTSLQPIAAGGFTCACGLPPIFGAPV